MFLTVRHFHDQNALRTYGQNGPLVPGQEELLTKTVNEIISILQTQKKTKTQIYTSLSTLRLAQTTQLIKNELTKGGFEVKITHHPLLQVMDQGDLKLPDNYQDGERFTPLEKAWDAICDESYINHNLGYQFGDHLNGKYPELQSSFKRVGQSMGRSLANKYQFINQLASNGFTKNDEQLIIVGQSDLPLLLIELLIAEKRNDVTSDNLPYKCWEIYKSGLQDKMYDKSAAGQGNFDIAMGYIGQFDLTHFQHSGFDKLLIDSATLIGIGNGA